MIRMTLHTLRSAPNSRMLPVAWTNSSYSGQKECVEAGALGGRVAVPDSKNPAGPAHVCDAAVWAAFLASVTTGRFA